MEAHRGRTHQVGGQRSERRPPGQARQRRDALGAAEVLDEQPGVAVGRGDDGPRAALGDGGVDALGGQRDRVVIERAAHHDGAVAGEPLRPVVVASHPSGAVQSMVAAPDMSERTSSATGVCTGWVW